MARNNDAMPLTPLDGCTPNCPPRPGRPGAPISPIISVSSVNGESGDIVLRELLVGNKSYNGSDTVEIFASDLGLGKALTYTKSIATISKTVEAMTEAKVGEIVYCTEDKLFYLSMGEGEYKTFVSGVSAQQYAKIVEAANKISIEINQETFELVAKLYDLNGNIIFESTPVLLPSGMKDAIKRGYYDTQTQEIVFVLKNDTEIRVPVAGLIDNVQPKITEANKLAFRLVEGLQDFKVATEQAIKTESEDRATAVSRETVARTQADDVEKTAREEADNLLRESLDQEIVTRKADDGTLTYNLSQEIDQRKYAFDLLKQQIEEEAEERVKVDAKVIQEIADRKQGDADLSADLRDEITARETADTGIKNDLLAESDARFFADNVLTINLKQETADRIQRDAELTDILEAETAARLTADDLLQQGIDQEIANRATAVANEAQERAQGDADLLDALHDESNVREANDRLLQRHIDEEQARAIEHEDLLQYHIDEEAKKRDQADNDLQVGLRNEINARETADRILQDNIDSVPKYSIARDSDAGDYSAVYHLTAQVKDGETINVGAPIVIPKDFLVKSATVRKVTDKTDPAHSQGNIPIGHTCIDFIINTKESVEPLKEEHIYVDVTTLVDIYTAGTGIEITNYVVSLNQETLDKLTSLSNALNKERDDRTAEDAKLSEELTAIDNTLDSAINQEVQARIAGDKSLRTELTGLITTEESERTTADKAEEEARKAADNALTASFDSKLATEESEREAADILEIQERSTAISQEATRRESADKTLQANIDATNQTVSNEITTRASEDAYLQEQINALNAKKDHYAGIIECNGTDTSYIITHNLNSYDVIVQTYDLGTYNTVIIDTNRLDANTIKLTFKDAPAKDKRYKVLCYSISDVVIIPRANGGTGSMAQLSATKGIAFRMPTCTFEAPEGKEFSKWVIGSASGAQVAAGGMYIFNADTEIYALWKDKILEPTIYSGTLTEVPPTSMDDLEGEYKTAAELLTNGFEKTFHVAADEFKHETFAFKKSLGLSLDNIQYFIGGSWQPMTDSFVKDETSTEIVYYHELAVNDGDFAYRLTFR